MSITRSALHIGNLINSFTEAIVDDGGTAASFTPSDYGTVNSWWDITDSTTITASGGACSQVDDKSGNGYNFTQATEANKPAYDVAGTLTFNGTTSFMTAGTVSDFKFMHDGTTDYSVVFVGHLIDSGSGNKWVLSEGASISTQRCQLGHNNDNLTEKVAGTVAGSGSTVIAFLSTNNNVIDLNTTTDHVYIWKVSFPGNGNDAFWAYLDGTLKDTKQQGAGTVSTSNGSVLTLGSLFGGASAFCQMVIKEMIIYTSTLSDTNISDITTQLQSKHGLS